MPRALNAEFPAIILDKKSVSLGLGRLTDIVVYGYDF